MFRSPFKVPHAGTFCRHGVCCGMILYRIESSFGLFACSVLSQRLLLPVYRQVV